jgi:hypothetical protein
LSDDLGFAVRVVSLATDSKITDSISYLILLYKPPVS